MKDIIRLSFSVSHLLHMEPIDICGPTWRWGWWIKWFPKGLSKFCRTTGIDRIGGLIKKSCCKYSSTFNIVLFFASFDWAWKEATNSPTLCRDPRIQQECVYFLHEVSSLLWPDSHKLQIGRIWYFPSGEWNPLFPAFPFLGASCSIPLILSHPSGNILILLWCLVSCFPQHTQPLFF